MILFLYNVTLKLYNAQIWVIVGVIYFDKSDINIYLYFQPHIINIYLYFQPQIQLQYFNDLKNISQLLKQHWNKLRRYNVGVQDEKV